ncbi:serine/threonine-protein kinase [Bifidobacterium samirii]|uniref:non-specific serine/threonine protein kinase n=1 Tax=Bifidobacterium samirii TaxID=2306974 RepID=A0A430FVS8_9BIFI|nr:serine/threonine-protein kinase [Bifidobacterium samirii]RSX58100.1 kinase [Bifidobacterium samirii]
MACNPPRFAYASDCAFIASVDDAGSGNPSVMLSDTPSAGDAVTVPARSPAKAPAAIGAPPTRIPGLPGYVFVRTIGSGSTATVHLYRDPATGERVALKIPSDPHDAHARRRLRGEADALSRLAGQPFVLPLLSTIELEGGAPGLVLAYAPSGSYRERMMLGPMAADEVIDLGIRLAGALCAAHRAGILHRDVKPANVLVMADGLPALSDFDVAADVYRPSVATGHSRPWAAPEVLSGRSGGTEASDVYALAATLYGLLAGMPPPGPVASIPGGGSSPAAGGRVPPMPDEVPEPLARVLVRALAVDPDERCRSAMEFRRALVRVRDDRTASGNGRSSGQPGIEDGAAACRHMAAPMPSAAGTAFHRNASASAPARSRDGRAVRTVPVTVFACAAVLPTAVALVSGSVPPPVASPSAGSPTLSVQRVASEGSTDAGGLADAPSAAVGYVPPVAGLSGREENGTVTFTWTNPDPRPGDAYAWRPVDGSGAALAAADLTDRERASVTLADGIGTCIRVDLVREGGLMSSVPAIACVAAEANDDSHARGDVREGESS